MKMLDERKIELLRSLFAAPGSEARLVEDVHALCDMAAQLLRSRGGWVKCSERLPEADTACLTWDVSGEIDIRTCVEKGAYKGFNFMGFSSNEITYWMPLPAAPKEDGHE